MRILHVICNKCKLDLTEQGLKPAEVLCRPSQKGDKGGKFYIDFCANCWAKFEDWMKQP